MNGGHDVKIIILLLVVLFDGIHAEAQGVRATQPKTQAATKSATSPKNKPETPHLEFVTEYIRELAATQEVRDSAENDLKQDPQAVFSNCIHSSTLMQLELESQVNQLKRMRLDDPFSDLIPNIIQFYQDKIELWRQMVDICSDFIGGPKPNVDYDKLAAEMPKTRAKLDFIDKALFDATPAIFMTLIDSKPDSKGHASHLLITKAEREDLIKKINTDFGSKLDEKGANYTVSSAWVLKEGLKKDFKSSDDPWD
jgi:hypothetical protein